MTLVEMAKIKNEMRESLNDCTTSDITKSKFKGWDKKLNEMYKDGIINNKQHEELDNFIVDIFYNRMLLFSLM